MGRNALLCATLVLGAGAAHAHEVLHSTEPGRAVAVRVYYPDGETLAYTEYEVFSPADARIQHQKGRTDRRGYLSFVPDAAGSWRVRVSDASGHGLETTVEISAEVLEALLRDGAGAGQGSATATGDPHRNRGIASWAFVLRPVLGVLAILAVFITLTWLHRRRRKAL